MKIEGPNKTTNTAAPKKGGEVSAFDAAAFRGLMSVDDPAEAPATSATRQIAALDSLLAIQATPDPTERAARKRMTARAKDILAALDSLRLGMLAGTLTVGHMIDIADVVAEHRDKIHDPQLTALMDEIDLRAQVEIAKLRVALDQTV
jgi:hypothetical protein